MRTAHLSYRAAFVAGAPWACAALIAGGLVLVVTIAAALTSSLAGRVHAQSDDLYLYLPLIEYRGGQHASALGTPRPPQDAPVRPAVQVHDKPDELLFSTFIGGIEKDLYGGFGQKLFQETVDAIALDAAGAVYVTGYTTAADLPVTAGALDTTCGSDGACNGGVSDAFVAKLSPDGRQLVYLTYLGGSDGDWGTGIAVDETGAAYVSGITQSLDFSAGKLWGKEGPPEYTQLRRGFVAKLSPDGSQLTYSAQFGQQGTGIYGIAVDATGSAFLTGSSGDADFPVTSGSAGADCQHKTFVVKLNPAGNALVYSACPGGADTSVGLAIAVDDGGNAYVAGVSRELSSLVAGAPWARAALVAGAPWARAAAAGTTSDLAALTPENIREADDTSVFQAYRPFDAKDDLFAIKLDPTGSQLLYRIEWGGSHGETIGGVALGPAGALYVAGTTHSQDFPTTAGVYDREFDLDTCYKFALLGFPPDEFPCRRGFVAKINAAGSTFDFSTFLGATPSDGSDETRYNGEEFIYGMAAKAGTVYVTGGTSSSGFPTTPGAYDRQCDLLEDFNVWQTAFVAKLSSNGQNLLHSTCLGGLQQDHGAAIAVDTAGAAVVGGTGGFDFPITAGAADSQFDQFMEGFVAKLALKATEDPEPPVTPGLPQPPPKPDPLPAPIVTPTGPRQPDDIAYIYSTDIDSRDSFRQLLEAHGLTVADVGQDDVGDHDFSPYCAVIVGADAETWSVADAFYLDAYGAPVIGIGLGGYAYLAHLYTPLGSLGYPGVGEDVNVLDYELWTPGCLATDSTLYHQPYELAAVGDLYTSRAAADHQISYKLGELSEFPNVAPIGSLYKDLSCINPHYPTSTVMQGGDQVIWGYGGSPAGMTRHGQHFFVNLTTYLGCAPIPQTPQIETLTVRGIGTYQDLPETGSPVRLEARLHIPEGYTLANCAWSGAPAPIEQRHDDTSCSYLYQPNTGPGPAAATYGEKQVTLLVTARHTETGRLEYATKSLTYKVFFAHSLDDDADSEPNWFDYWGDDGAVPLLAAADVVYDPTDNGYGSWLYTTDKVSLGFDAGGMHYPEPVVIPPAVGCPARTFGGATGIDCVAEVIAHERKHEELWDNWNKNGTWTIGATVDSDDPTPSDKSDIKGDLLPDAYEINTTGTDPQKLDTCDLRTWKHEDYKWYGDEELVAMRAGDGKKGVASRDWADPGKQAGGQSATIQVATSDTASGPGPGGSPASSVMARATVASGFATLTGVYADTGVDTDGDGAYNHLRLDVGVEVVEAGLYNVVAWLSASNGAELAWAAHQQSLAPGSHTVELQADGTLLHRSGQDGPYAIARVEVRIGERELLADAADDAGATAAYAYTDFDPPDIASTGTYSETIVDANQNGLADILRIQVAVDVQRAGKYTVIGELDAGSPLVATRTVMDLTPGIRTMTLDFDGPSLFQNRIDGPYALARLRLLDAESVVYEGKAAAYTTNAYLHTAFEHTGTTIDAASYVVGLADDDEDGRFEALRLLFLVNVDQPGDYWVTTDLYDADQRVIAHAGKNEELYLGTAMVVLDFSATDIAQHGVDGPYTIQFLTLVDETGAVVDVHPVAYTTKAYGYRLFAVPERLFLPTVRR